MQIYRTIFALLIFFTNLGYAADISEIYLGTNQDGTDLGMGHYKPTSPANGAAIIFIVSGGMHSGLDMQSDYEPRFLPLVEDGFTVFTVRHSSNRNIPDPQIFIPTIFNQASLAYKHIVQHATEYSIDPQKIGVLGISSGGVLAYFLSLSDVFSDGSKINERPKAVAIYAGPSELRGNFPSLSAINLVSKDDPPLMLIHGNADEVVPFSNSENINSALKNYGVTTELIEIKDGGHDAIQKRGGETIFNEAVLRWFTNYLVD